MRLIDLKYAVKPPQSGEDKGEKEPLFVPSDSGRPGECDPDAPTPENPLSKGSQSGDFSLIKLLESSKRGGNPNASPEETLPSVKSEAPAEKSAGSPPSESREDPAQVNSLAISDFIPRTDEPVISPDDHHSTIGDCAGEKLYSDIQKTLVGLLQKVVAKERFWLEPLVPMVEQLIGQDKLMETLYRLSFQKPHSSYALSNHMLHVAVYSVKMGKKLKFEQAQLSHLALAALLHDVGMCMIPKTIPYKEGALTPEELDFIKSHPNHGHRIILDHLGETFDWLAETVRQEHEREDGSGYPRGLSGHEIGEMAKLIGISDVYEALTSNRPDRRYLTPYKAVQVIINRHKRQFAPHILKVMIHELSLFPLNSLVRLNSGAIARVVETHRIHPLRPTVQIVSGGNGNGIGRVIPLHETHLLHIVESVDATNPTATRRGRRHR
jgi:HD-GYP domain-containing protein (c-di-GMP phosphodiesterase class II)